MKTIRIILTIVAALTAVQFVPSEAHATVTASISGEDGGGAFSWDISYDDQTREVTTTASGTGFALETVQVTSSISRTVAYYPFPGAQSIVPGLAAAMAAADFQVIADGSTTVLASGIPPAQVRRIVGKAGAIGGFQSDGTWSRA